MIFTQPISFREAVAVLAKRKVMPTVLTSADLSQLPKQIMRTSFVSAQNTITGSLDRLKAGIASILDPQQVTRPGEPLTVTEGFNPATLRTFMKGYYDSISYTAPAGKEGTIEDLSSDKRINLTVDTNVKIMQGAGHFIQANDQDVVDFWPAWEFKRFGSRREPRDWAGMNGLWINACRRAGDKAAMRVYGATQRMCALKSSEVWNEISDPDYTPGGLGEPYDPVAFGTGMGREEMSRDEAEEIGLLGKDEKAEPARFDLTDLFGGEEAA